MNQIAKTKTNRIEWVDTAKGITIILVVMGHANFPEPLRALIYSFHMPLFFFLSGLFLIKKGESFKTFLKKKFKGLIIPYIFYNIILILFNWFLWFISKNPNLKENIFIKIISLPLALRIDDTYDSKLWFLPCLFITSIIFYFFYRKNKNIYLASCVIIPIIGLYLRNILQIKVLPWSIDICFIVYIFIICANIFKTKLQYMFKTTHDSYRTLIICFLIFITSTYLNYYSCGYKGINIYESNYGNFLFFYISGITGIWLIIRISKMIKNNNFLIFIGKNSLIIYVTHYIFLAVGFQITKYLANYIYPDFNGQIFLGIIITLICIIACLPTILFINKYLSWTIGK